MPEGPLPCGADTHWGQEPTVEGSVGMDGSRKRASDESRLKPNTFGVPETKG